MSSWLDRVVAIQERRPHQFIVCFTIVVFVSVVRSLLEWIVGHQPLTSLNQSTLGFVSYYLMVLFLYSAPLAVLIRQPWQRSMNVVQAAVFCGILPPLIDGVVTGPGTFRYQYVFDFPSGWPWTLYAPERAVPIGESVVLWLTIALMGIYVFRKTASLARAAVALAAAYALVAFHGAILPTALTLAFPQSGWNMNAEVITYGQLGVTLLLYVVFRPAVALGLLKRAHHTVPFILVCLIGAAMKGPLDGRVLWNASLVFLAFIVALAQNDFFDRDEDARQGRAPYVDREDVVILNTIFLLFVITLIATGSAIGYILFIIFVVSMLYSHPLYRAKRFFPANLKSEGVWGASAFLVGVVASGGGEVAIDPMMLPLAQAGEQSADISATFDRPTLVALALVFCGWSLVAALKDFKDIRADARSRIQTTYTLAVKRGWGLRRVHLSLIYAVGISMIVPFALLAWTRGWPPYLAAAGIPFGFALFAAASRGPSRAGFQSILATINIFLVAILIAFSTSA